jgi:hypothetical protein
MKINKTAISALTLSSLLMISNSPAYAVTTITIGVDPNTEAVVGELISSFEVQFCEDPSSSFGELTCEIPLLIWDSADIRDDIVNSGSAATNFDLFISSNTDSSDLYDKYQFSHPNVVVGKPFDIASDSVILLSAFPGPGIDVSSGFPKHLAEGIKFAMADPVTDAYGVVSAQILASSPNLKSALSHAEATVGAIAAYSQAQLYDPTQPWGTPFAFVPKSAACWQSKAPLEYSTYDFSQQEKLKKINSIKVTGITIGRERNKEETALLNSFISYITGKSNGNGSANTAAEVLHDEYCYVPSTAKKETEAN